MVLNDLLAIKEKELAARKPLTLRCCLAAGCISSHASDVKAQLEKAVQDAGLEDKVQVRGVGCLRLCSQGPLVQADPDGALYQKVRPEDAGSIIATLHGGATSVAWGDLDHPFSKRQFSIVLANCGVIDPERIED